MSPTSGPSEPSGPPVEPLRILFVCTANICRSPYAELTTRDTSARENLAIEVRSAGTHGRDAEPMDSTMAAELGKRGIDPTRFRSHAVTREDIAWADLVLTMEAAHRTYLIDDHPVAVRKIFGLGHFAHRLDTVEQRGRPAIEAVARHRGAAHSDEDIPDPYRRGLDAVELSAERIDGYLARLLPAIS